jgi:septal ring factor EnvC (AmiA/AmiB activator)
MSTETVPATEEQPKKAGSGYARLRNRHRVLIADHETLRKSYQEMFSQQGEILAELQRKSEECQQLQSMYAALQSDVELVLAENQRLLDAVAVLRSNAAQVQPHYQPQPAYQPQPRPVTPPGLPSLFARGYR